MAAARRPSESKEITAQPAVLRATCTATLQEPSVYTMLEPKCSPTVLPSQVYEQYCS
jgi:hypothetical protein